MTEIRYNTLNNENPPNDYVPLHQTFSKRIGKVFIDLRQKITDHKNKVIILSLTGTYLGLRTIDPFYGNAFLITSLAIYILKQMVEYLLDSYANGHFVVKKAKEGMSKIFSIPPLIIKTIKKYTP